ncbi:hypothetical protein [uncultured Shewanella sp.]|uniref:hypothetical protein n=1 Tax=uncultured Shewanella sp. TaxID=173975 RepID=UPI00262F5DC9|nr:hypothetical protein [uncultured Shewanella sp.]
MDIFKEKPYLLTLLVSLVLARFIGVPLVEWQDNQKIELQLESKRLAKAERAVANQQTIAPLLEPLREKVNQNRDRLYPYQSENAFKLEQQKQLESLIQNYGLKVSGIGWLITKQLDEFDLTLYQLQVRFMGDGVRFPNLMAELESRPKWVEVADFNFAFRRQGKTKIGEASGQMTLNFYMQSELSK